MDAHLPAGYYEVKFNGGALATGTYVYMLDAGPHREARLMLLVR